MKTFFLKKLIPLSLLLSVICGVVAFSQPQKAHATAVVDAGNIAQSTITAANTTVSSYNTLSLQIKAFFLDTFATTLVKILIRKITADVVNWINGGFEGSPAFVTNPGGFLLDAADQVSGAFLAEAGGPLASLCSPFSIDLRLALSFKYHPNVPQRYECTISKIIANSKTAIKGATINGFAAGDFRQGGWPAFVSMTTEPQNNVYGAYLEADSELSVRVANFQIGKKEEINNGKGFLSWRNPECKKQVNDHNASVKKTYQDGNVSSNIPTGNPGNSTPSGVENIASNGSRSSNTAASIDAFSQTAAAGDSDVPATPSDPLGNVDFAANPEPYNAYIDGGDVSSATTLKSVNDCPIETPGSLIENTLAEHIGGPLRELELVDSINEIVNALAAALVTKVLQTGLSAVSGSGPSDSTAYLNQIQAQAKSAEIDTNRNDFLQSLEVYLANTLQYKTNKDQSLKLALDVKAKYDLVGACYSQKINANPQTLTPAQVAQANSLFAEANNVASTTTGALIPALMTGATNAQTRYQTLITLKNQATAATTVNDINAPATKFAQMVQNQTLTTAKDIFDSQTELDSVTAQTATMTQDANRRYTDCQAFPYGATQAFH